MNTHRRIFSFSTFRIRGVMKRVSTSIVIAAFFALATSAASGVPPRGALLTGLSGDQSAGGPPAPSDLLASFRTFCVKSHTVYMHEGLMQRTLQERPEFVAWGLKGAAMDAADVIIEIRLPFLTWEWNYKIVNRTNGGLLGMGKVKALEEHQAAPLLAAEIAKTILPARGVPETHSNIAPPPAPRRGALKKWHVKGATGPFQDKDLTLSIGRESISISELPGQGLEIPTQSVLSAYHIVSDDSDKRRQSRKSWEGGWDKACEMTSGEDMCLAILGAPIWLIGDAILMIPGPSTHFVVIRWQDDQAVNEASFQVGTLHWKDILRDLQAAVPDDTVKVSADMSDLRKELDLAKHRALKISLHSSINVGRWPPLQAGDYRVVLVERSQGRAEVFFFVVADKQFNRPRAVAAAHLKTIPPGALTPVLTFREKDGMNLIDEIRADNIVLTFD
jgi:hypothetical protein